MNHETAMTDSNSKGRRPPRNGTIIRRLSLVCCLCLGFIYFIYYSATSSRDAHGADDDVLRSGTDNGQQGKAKRNQRKFVSYTSSKWEQLWLDNVKAWTDSKQICEVLFAKEQRDYMHDFLTMLCTAQLAPPNEDWCEIDDDYKPLYYNTKDRHRFKNNYTLFFKSESPFSKQPTIALQAPTRPVVPTKEHEHLVSKFVFLDEETGSHYVEYIEPLVSHLRFPLARCLNTSIWPIPYALFRGYVLPPQEPPRGLPKTVYFDAGSSSWSEGGGGPSLKAFVNLWGRYGIDFQQIFAYEMTTERETFYKTVPEEYRDRTHYRQCAVASSVEHKDADHPFIPHEIEEFRKKANDKNNDYYVFFKLDIDSPKIEGGSIDYILDSPDLLVHEIAWEHHVRGNYLMKGPWSGPAGFDEKTLEESYHIFLKLRQRGIRAHSWV